MAELDDKLLKNLDATLQSMNQHLQGLEQTLSGVKGSMNAAFDPSILKEWTNAMRGMKAARIVDAESLKGVEEIKTVFNDISILRKEISQGKGFRLFSESELNQARTQLAEIQDTIALLNNMSKAGKLVDSDYAYLGELRAQRDILKQQLSMGGAFDVTLNEEDMRRKIELLARYKEERKNLLKGEQQRGVELANIKKKEEQAEETALRKAMANVKRQIDAKTQLTRIEHEREERARAGSKLTQQQIDAENRKYQALEETIQRLAKQGYQQFGSAVMGQAYLNNKPYEFYSQAKEDQRHLAQLQKIEEQQKKNTEETKKQEKALREVEMTAERLKNALVAAFGIHQIKRFASEILKVRGEFEMSEVALTNIIGNAEKAQTIWNKTMNLAINSPLSAMQLTRYTKQLAAFRVETGKLFDTTKMLADVSVGLGVDMERLILAYGHTRSSGFLRGMYARQFATAGVNIYGELADYYTKLEGHLVTFRDVYERISKKLVTFADVEKVFEKITGEGGTFYNMQEKLTNTVQGQINKIKDTWQQAMNTIGKSDQGFIRRITDIVLNIVKNWRIWLRLIESTTAAIVMFKATQLTAALFNIQSGAIAASKGMARLATSIKALGKNIAASPAGLILTVVTAVGVELYSLYKNMRDYNREIDKNNLVLYDARQRLLDYEERIRANNAAIEEYGKKSKKTEEEQESLSKAQSDNANVVSALRKEYPELTEGLEQQANGYVELTKKIEAHNRSLREQVGLNQLMKQQGWFNEGFETDADDYFTKIQKDQAKVIGSIEKMRVAIMAQGIDEGELPQVLRDIIDIDWSNPIAGLERYNELLGQLYKIREQRISDIQDELLSRGEIQYKGSGAAQMVLENSKEYKEFLYEYADAFDKLAGKVDLTTHAYKEFAKNFVIPEKDEDGESIPSMVNTFAMLYLKELETQISDLSTKGEEGKVKEQFSKWLEEENHNLAEVVLKHGGQINKWTEEGLLTANETTRQVLINQGKAITKDRQAVLNDELRVELAFIAKQEELAEIRAQLADEEEKKLTKRSKARIDELRKQVKDSLAAVEKEWDAFVEQTSGDGGGEEKPPTTPTYKNLDELLELLKKMNSEYNKLSKSAYGFAKSQEVVMKNYKDAFDEILGKDAGDLVSWATLDITSKGGLEAAFKELEKSLNDKNLWGKYGKDVQKLQAKMKKAIADQGVEIDMDVQVRIREDFGKQMEEAFNDYELTLELQKLNIPSDAAKDLFPDFTEKTLGDLQKRLREFYEERQKKDENGNVLFSEEDLKEYRKWSDKIDSEILKERKEKAKQYSKYLEKEYSERAKLEMQHAKDVAFVTANVVDETQRKTIIANINKKYQDDLNELKWKSFKESSFYVDMMDDIASLPAEYTRMMLDKINEILEHPEKLSPRALKEAINARQKVIEAQIATKPLSVMTNASKEVREARKLLKQDEEITVKWWESTRRALDEQIKTEANSIAEDEKKIDSLKQLQGELAGYEQLVEDLKNATSKVDNEGINKLLGIEGDEDITKLDEKAIKNRIKSLNDLMDSEKQLYDPSEKTDEQNARAVEIEQIEKMVAALNDELNARKALASYVLPTRVINALAEGETSASVGSQIAGIEASKEGKQKRLTTWKEYRKQFKNFSEAFADFNKNVNDMVVKVRDMGNALYDMFDALGGETNVLTDGWKEFGNTMTDVFTKTLTLIPQMVVAFQAAGTSINASLGVIGLIAEAVQLVFVAIGAFAKLHDAKYEREIEIQQKKIDSLTRAYERLEKQIEKTWDTVSYITTYNEETQNLYDQIAAIKDQISAEEAKKNADKDKIQGYEDSIQEALDKLEELKQAQIEVFGGIGENNYRSAAEGFVDAWKSAFLETGDGLQGLQDHFDEFLNDWFVKQATMRVTGRMLEPLFRQIDSAVDQYGSGGANVLMSELSKIRERFGIVAPQLSEALEELAGMWGLQGEGGLSGLAAGIQGMTEEQANVLESYWNSVRGYTASIDMNVARIVDMMVANYGGGRSVESNPMLQQLNLIAANTAATHTILQSVTKSGHTMGGSGIKVFVD